MSPHYEIKIAIAIPFWILMPVQSRGRFPLDRGPTAVSLLIPTLVLIQGDSDFISDRSLTLNFDLNTDSSRPLDFNSDSTWPWPRSKFKSDCQVSILYLVMCPFSILLPVVVLILMKT
ncbi:hypothetical protein EVAR_42824_1 [Eumeta japonica]|uniref:Uncharacterized protein n=1 Tax=Eumeta variegata TaxID=151549 RepID=A0A4C1WGD6_EUMVA|nr:hypothetical protein EVAR_42824_1 [Eumeta japonica]